MRPDVGDVLEYRDLIVLVIEEDFRRDKTDVKRWVRVVWLDDVGCVFHQASTSWHYGEFINWRGWTKLCGRD